MKALYDYQELLDELYDEIGTGSLTKDETIQILRTDKVDKNGYRQIIDWYYNDEVLKLELAPEKSDSQEDASDKALLKAQYLKDQSNLEALKVDVCLAEITKLNKPKSKKTGNPFF